MSSIHEILAEFRQAAASKRDLGDKFERLFATFLVTEPRYRERFTDVWMWSEWPGRANKPDTGIDLVAQEREGGGLCAIQCKFYDPDSRIEKANLDSFFATSGRAPFTSRIVVTTTDNWSAHAEDLLNDDRVPCVRVRLQDLHDSAVDWSKFSLSRPDVMRLKPKNKLRPHQALALEAVLVGLAKADRGKLIMACGTGKTFTALKIAERFLADRKKEPSGPGRILYLVPSIALLGQALSEWSAQSETPMYALAVCSDTAVGKQGGSKADDTADIRLHDLPFPASTDARKLARQLAGISGKKPLTVVFSTYQSIATIHDAQKLHGAAPFDLVICDEAHRTTGVTLADADESHFVRIHDANYITAGKRLYMTATPRIYMDAAKSKANEAEAELCSMDDESLYGQELHRLGFGEAINQELLADYKVMVLAVDEKFVSKTFQKELAAAGKAKGKAYDDYFSDLVKITGCWNGLGKRMATGEDSLLAADTLPMRRAVAFSRSIAASKQIKELFAGIVEKYASQAPEDEQDSILRCEVDHVDGTMNALRRRHLLDWLKADTADDENVCRILSNARCLSEGVDVPALDAVLFLNPRNSVVDVVQSVGRVMRRAPGKRYGYIILPVGIPADIPPEEALKDNERYKVVWQVLQALRSHDERIEAAINKIDLTGRAPENISVIGVGAPADDEEAPSGAEAREKPAQYTLDFPELDQWRDAIFAKLVLKCGDRRYWESWANDVAQIAERQVTRIKALLESPDSGARSPFEKFLAGLRSNLNPAVSEGDAVEMLAQHLITQPVFDALFEGYAFTQRNPVSQSMQKMLDVLNVHGLGKEAASLEKFYASVRLRASGIDSAEGRQRIIVELYDKFFRSAFPRMAERLGIVYTPVELVDFILKSVDDALRSEFGESLSSSGVQVLDPFTGTGTFIVRMLQGGFVRPQDLERKYARELHANEIVLLAYYIAAVNIEAAYHGQLHAIGQPAKYAPFEGIVLTDTFQLTEGKGTLDDLMFPQNNRRAKRQSNADIRVIVGNPPYSAQQESENDDNKNLKYPSLDARIGATYGERSSAVLKKNLYDSYNRAIRWASDRIKDRGIVCFVTNGSFVDETNLDGVRKCLAVEFSRVYVFNLRGNQRTAGEESRKEGGKIFGAGSRATVAITLLVKNPTQQSDGRIHYYDVGDYLTREEKLQEVRRAGSMSALPWRMVTPNAQGDWINMRDPAFTKFMPLGDKRGGANAVFEYYSLGVVTNRDPWVYNFSLKRAGQAVAEMVAFFNKQVRAYGRATRSSTSGQVPDVDDVIERDAKRISWTRNLKEDVRKLKDYSYDGACFVTSQYRPFMKQHLYFSRRLNEMVYRVPSMFPGPDYENLVISITGVADRKGFSALIADHVPNMHLTDTGQCFPLYYYVKGPEGDLLGDGAGQWIRRDAISDSALTAFQSMYADQRGSGISKEDLFYYVYGILHSPEYKQRFEADLRKQLPRIPYVADFWAFSSAGRELARWHLGYEAAEPYPLSHAGELDLGDPALYRVQKMTWARKRVDGKLTDDKSTLIYNSRITLTGIPPDAFEYIVAGKSALEWVVERYQVTADKDSGIVNDPNDWATEHNDPAYIFNLVKRIVRVSLETVAIVRGLPPLRERV